MLLRCSCSGFIKQPPYPHEASDLQDTLRSAATASAPGGRMLVSPRSGTGGSHALVGLPLDKHSRSDSMSCTGYWDLIVTELRVPRVA
jgi:hypothetical protein